MPDAPPPFYGAPTSIWVGVFELVDPLESLAVALFRGLSWNWVWTALPGVVLIVLLGRFFCGWACPYLPILAAANAARWVLTRLGVPLADLRVPRVTSFVVMVGVLVVGGLAGTLLVPLVYPPAIIGREVFCAIFYGSAADPLELLVSVDPYLSDSARVSDLVLPASTFAESEDVDANDKNVAGKSLVPPLPGSMPDFTILTRLAHAVGLGQYFPWATFHEAMNATHVPWMEEASMQPRPEVAEGYRPLFGTVTGKAVFASTLLERVGKPACPNGPLRRRPSRPSSHFASSQAQASFQSSARMSCFTYAPLSLPPHLTQANTSNVERPPQQLRGSPLAASSPSSAPS